MENGKYFNQEPYQCPYSNGSSMYNCLLEFMQVKSNYDQTDNSSSAKIKKNPKIIEYICRLDHLEDLKDEVEDGVSDQKDLSKEQGEAEKLYVYFVFNQFLFLEQTVHNRKLIS